MSSVVSRLTGIHGTELTVAQGRFSQGVFKYVPFADKDSVPNMCSGFFRRNYVFLSTVFVGAFAFEM